MEHSVDRIFVALDKAQKEAKALQFQKEKMLFTLKATLQYGHIVGFVKIGERFVTVEELIATTVAEVEAEQE